MRLLYALLLVAALAIPCLGQTPSIEVRDSSVTQQMREHWAERMSMLERGKPAVCVFGRWTNDSTFVIDSISEPKRRCEFNPAGTLAQGALGFYELQATNTYPEMRDYWKGLIAQHPGMLFIGSMVGYAAGTKRPVIWAYVRKP